MTRKRLPSRRMGQRATIEWNGQEWNCGVGLYDDGTPGEVWCNATRRLDSHLDVLANDCSVLISLLLQRGVTARHLKTKMSKQKSLAGVLIDLAAEIETSPEFKIAERIDRAADAMPLVPRR